MAPFEKLSVEDLALKLEYYASRIGRGISDREPVQDGWLIVLKQAAAALNASAPQLEREGCTLRVAKVIADCGHSSVQLEVLAAYADGDGITVRVDPSPLRPRGE